MLPERPAREGLYEDLSHVLTELETSAPSGGSEFWHLGAAATIGLGGGGGLAPAVVQQSFMLIDGSVPS